MSSGFLDSDVQVRTRSRKKSSLARDAPPVAERHECAATHLAVCSLVGQLEKLFCAHFGRFLKAIPEFLFLLATHRSAAVPSARSLRYCVTGVAAGLNVRSSCDIWAPHLVEAFWPTRLARICFISWRQSFLFRCERASRWGGLAVQPYVTPLVILRGLLLAILGTYSS